MSAKITQLTEATSISSTDLFTLVASVSTTPKNKKITYDTLSTVIWNDPFFITRIENKISVGKTWTTAWNTYKLQWYDVDWTSYVDFLNITAWNTPICTLSWISSIWFSLTPTITPSIWQLYWDSSEDALSYDVLWGSIAIWKEVFDYYTNLSWVTLVDWDVVSVVWVSWNRVAVSLTDATSVSSATACVWMVTQWNTNNHTVRVTKIWAVHWLNTNSFVEWMPVYVDPLNPWKLTQTVPDAPNFLINVWIVTLKQNVNWIIDVVLWISPKMQDLSDVNWTALTVSGQIPVWNNTSKYFDFTANIHSYELLSNKVTSISVWSTDIQYPSAKLLYDQLLLKQDSLQSWTNIKTINSSSILWSWNISLEVPLTFWSWLTRTVNSIANNLITGISWWQTVIWWTWVNDKLILQWTTWNWTLTWQAIDFNVWNNGWTNAWRILNNWNVQFWSATNYSEFESDWSFTLHWNATVFNDLIWSALSLQQTWPWVSFNNTESTVDFITTSNLSDYIIANYQMSHSWLAWSHIDPHIHFDQTQNTLPNFLIRYRWQKNWWTKTTAWTDYKCNTPIHTYVSWTLNQIVEWAWITPPVWYNLSDVLQFRIFRDNANTSWVFAWADPYTATVWITFIDIHYELDSIWSRQEYIK